MAHDATGRDAAGTMLLDQQVLHVYAYRGELVERMTIDAADSFFPGRAATARADRYLVGVNPDDRVQAKVQATHGAGGTAAAPTGSGRSGAAPAVP